MRRSFSRPNYSDKSTTVQFRTLDEAIMTATATEARETTSSSGGQKDNSLTRLTKSTYYYNKQLLRTGAFADCTITCQGQSWPAHRNILSPRCDFFKCCFDGRFEEAGTRVIRMEDDDPFAVEGMLYFVYTQDYPLDVYVRLLGLDHNSGSDSGIEDEDSAADDTRVYWWFDLLMYTIADKYGLSQLRELAAQSLRSKAELAAKKRGQFLKSLDGFVTLIEELYAINHISEHLRELRTQVLSSMCETITHHIRDQRLSALLADIPKFAVELVEVLGKKRDDGERMQREDEKKQKAVRVVLCHIPMNDESDCED